MSLTIKATSHHLANPFLSSPTNRFNTILIPLLFRYPKEKWDKDCIEPIGRRGEKGISQMMTGCFYGQTHGLFLPVFPDPTSARGGVTGKSIINVYEHYDFLGIWEDIREKVGDKEVFVIIDNAKTHLPFKRWLRW